MKILIAGFGSIGRRHFRNLKVLGLEDISFLRTHTGTLKDDEIEEYSAFTNIYDALQDKPDVVFVTNPTARHLDIAVPAVEAGCHLFIEKPISHNLNGCKELLDVVDKKGLITMIGCQFRFHPLLKCLCEELEGGRIGEVLGARAEWGEYLPGWHPWEDHRLSYSARKDLGGGSISTLIHPLDYLYWLFGDVRKAYGSMRSIPSLETDTDDDLAEITMEFMSGVISQVHLDYIQRPPVHTLTVLGDDGRAHWDFYAGMLQWESVDGHIVVERVPHGFDRNMMFMDELCEFLGCVEQHKPTCVPLADGIAVVDIALRIKENASERSE